MGRQSNAKPGDLLLVLSGELNTTRNQMNELRLHMGDELGLRNPNVFKPLWVVDFPLLEWDEESVVTTPCTTLLPLQNKKTLH